MSKRKPGNPGGRSRNRRSRESRSAPSGRGTSRTPDLFDDAEDRAERERVRDSEAQAERGNAPNAETELDLVVEEALAALQGADAANLVAPDAAGAAAAQAGAPSTDAGRADAGVAGGSGGGSGEPPRRGIGLEPIPTDGDQVPLSVFASRAYLDYAMSVLKGRALPDVADGQKPVQRRILYVMQELGLAPNAKPIKSARVVGDVLGKYHPHGDTAAYDAMVRMAQDFSLRYPLVDGHGNYGSRDGDAAAAYRYTEARLTAFASHVLLSEIGQGTVEFVANYDGAFREPQLLPARLPVALLNGASGIAVGMATEIPAHNLNEVAAAAIAVVKAKGRRQQPTVDDLLALMPGPDFPGGGQIISAPEDIADAYRSGRGTIRLRARWTFEVLARGQWQAVISELPHGVSTARVLSEIEDLSNPRVRPGRKAVTQEQQQQKALLLGVLDRVRDESDKEHPVRIVIEPRTSKVDRAELVNTLLALTSLETGYSINLVMLGLDGRPRQKDLATILGEWTDFRIATVERRCRHRLGQVDDRLHVLEGRLVVHLNVDKVVKTIREADEPKAALIARFRLSDRQAEDILEMRLRQLARLESIRIEQEIKALQGERGELEELLTNPASLRRLVIREIESDAKRFGDNRRTLIKPEGTASRAQVVVDEPVTVLVSGRGWLKTRVGHDLDPATFTFKEGDALRAFYEARTTESVTVLSTDGRAYSIAVMALPGGKSDGAPASSFIELAPGAKVAQVFMGPPDAQVLLATSGGYGFVCQIRDMASRIRAGKQFMSVEAGEAVLPPAPIGAGANRVVAVSAAGKMLVFPLDEMRTLSGGGRGVQTLVPDPRDQVVGIAATAAGVIVAGTGRGGKTAELVLSAKDLAEYLGHRARKGRLVPYRIKPTGVLATRPAERR